eukprot:TRINITY_DN633_c0_g1_i1.p1 TRINITY_DN633_c0_g1~~TRINITY_DN633_c0_g1_i1.p1  ORF type:complete len:130 (-),score=46.29 TRINITY_DN633_c0_g1_i1:160-549(-)
MKHFVIDAEKYGNEMRFINADAKKFNCCFEGLHISEENRVRVMTEKRIQPGEQLLIDYGKDFYIEGVDMNLSHISLSQTSPVRINRVKEGEKEGERQREGEGEGEREAEKEQRYPLWILQPILKGQGQG